MGTHEWASKPVGVAAGPPVDRRLMALAVRVAHSAGQLSVDRFYAGERVSYKGDGTEVTAADVAVEGVIRAELARYAPDDGFIGEEAGDVSGSSGRRWIIDPIDGTYYFVNRIPGFCNNLAYEDEHGLAIGVINLPVQQELVFAGRGLGCFVLRGADPDIRRAESAQVSDRDRVDGAKAAVWGMDLHTWSQDLLVALHRRLRLWLVGTSGVAMLATGRVDAVVMPDICDYWDWAPVPVIVAEAGGRMTDFKGDPLPGEGSGIASNASLHESLLALVAGLPRGRDVASLDPDSASGHPPGSLVRDFHECG